jgi:hypothetical protein
MNACYWSDTDGEFTPSDIIALRTLHRGPAPGTPVQCMVLNDDGSRSNLSDAIYYYAPGLLCAPGGSQGVCAKWFGNCSVIGEGTPVTFAVFNDANTAQTGQSSQVYARGNNEACIPDGTSTGTCRKWFGASRTSDGRDVECFLFDDGYTNMVGPTSSMFFSAPGKICMPNGESSGTCRRWFGRCQIRQR